MKLFAYGSVKAFIYFTLVSAQLGYKVLEDRQGLRSLISVPFTPSPSPAWQLLEDRRLHYSCLWSCVIATLGHLQSHV